MMKLHSFHLFPEADLVAITEEKIDIDLILQQTQNSATGGVVVFLGRVRDHSEDKKVVKMEYFAYEKMAISELAKIERSTRSLWQVEEISIIHPLGMQHTRDISVAIAVACAHRVEAFEACRFIIDSIKKTVPIWKKEYGVNGSEWVDGAVPVLE